MGKGIYVYQQIAKTAAEWAQDTNVYPENTLLFEKLENGKFNIVIADGEHTYSELPSQFTDVVVREHNGNSATSYKLVFTTPTGTYTTPNLKVSASVTENTTSSYRLSFRIGDTIIETPNLKGDGASYIPDLASAPDEDTLTYTKDGVSIAFSIGQQCRVPSQDTDSGYTFYVLANIESVEGGTNKAVWQEVGSGNLRQQVEENKAEIEALKAKIGAVGFSVRNTDVSKTMQIIGDSDAISLFNDWVDNSPKPCEVKKDMTDFAYLKNTAGVASSTNWTKRADGSNSHYNTSDKANYLQMVELENVNVSFENNGTTTTVLFNFSDVCPAGFHRWFPESTKLFSRYDSTKNATNNSLLDVMCGGNWTGNNSVDVMDAMNKATNANILEWTAWEIAVLGWLMAMRFNSLDLQTALGKGIQNGSQAAAEAFVNGFTDSLTTPHGKVAYTGGSSTDNEAVRFMYIENPYGLRWIWGAGWRGNAGTGYLTFDDVKANVNKLMATTDADITHTYPTNLSGTYAKNVDMLGICIETGGSSTSGYFDGNWSNNNSDRIFYAGGDSAGGALDGPFARRVGGAAASSTWGPRGRCAVRRSVVTAAA